VNDRRLFLLDSRQSVETETFVRESGCTVIRIDLCETPSSESLALPDRLRQNLQRILDACAKTPAPSETNVP
jgi:hypothetical protein